MLSLLITTKLTWIRFPRTKIGKIFPGIGDVERNNKAARHTRNMDMATYSSNHVAHLIQIDLIDPILPISRGKSKSNLLNYRHAYDSPVAAEAGGHWGTVTPRLFDYIIPNNLLVLHV